MSKKPDKNFAEEQYKYLMPKHIDFVNSVFGVDVHSLDKIKFKASQDFYVYFLFKGGILIYVGSTFDLEGRLRSHTSTRDFDTYSKIAYGSRQEVLNAERLFINKYLPEGNMDMLTKKHKGLDNQGKPVNN